MESSPASPSSVISLGCDLLHRPSLKSLIMAVAVLGLVALSIVRTYSLGHHQRMYDNPVYRWRESLAIALSRMQDPALNGYLAFRSIRNSLAEQGLALLPGEAPMLPTPEQRHNLVRDGARMNQLIQQASRVPIDSNLPPVILTGNELGLSDFFYWAFRIFGLNLNALVLLYYSILLVSVAAFLVTFRRSPFSLLLLMLYLIGHYFAVNYANNHLIQTIHNSRFFPVLSLLPAMHLLLLLLRRERLTVMNISAAAIQTVIIFFVMFCRSQAFWQVLAIPAGALLVVSFGALRRALRRPSRWPIAVKRITRDMWPVLLLACGFVGLVVYGSLAPDARFYSSESKSHVFWHTLYIGLISTDPELAAQYGYGEDTYSDTMGYVAALQDLRGRNEVPPELAEVVDGVININVIKDSGAYDRVIRRVFFQVVGDHPWPALRSFFVGKPSDQYTIFTHVPELWQRKAYVEVLALGLGAVLLSIYFGAGLPHGRQWRRLACALLLVAMCSWITPSVIPSPVIPDVIVLYVMMVLLILMYLPLALVSRWISATIAPREQTTRSHQSGAEFQVRRLQEMKK
jgi:hypothetical protein